MCGIDTKLYVLRQESTSGKARHIGSAVDGSLGGPLPVHACMHFDTSEHCRKDGHRTEHMVLPGWVTHTYSGTNHKYVGHWSSAMTLQHVVE